MSSYVVPEGWRVEGPPGRREIYRGSRYVGPEVVIAAVGADDLIVEGEEGFAYLRREWTPAKKRRAMLACTWPLAATATNQSRWLEAFESINYDAICEYGSRLPVVTVVCTPEMRTPVQLALAGALGFVTSVEVDDLRELVSAHIPDEHVELMRSNGVGAIMIAGVEGFWDGVAPTDGPVARLDGLRRCILAEVKRKVKS